jgi:hypothetical protein
MDLHSDVAWMARRLGIPQHVRSRGTLTAGEGIGSRSWAATDRSGDSPLPTLLLLMCVRPDDAPQIDPEEIRDVVEALNARRAADDAPPDPSAGLERMVGAMKRTTNPAGLQGVETDRRVGPPWPPGAGVACADATATRNHQTR